MPQIASIGNLSDVISALRKDPAKLGFSSERVNISVAYSSTKKQYTNFHRLDVVDQDGASHRFWLRTIKNKPAEAAMESLTKQFRVQTELSRYLQRHSSPNLQLGCSEAVVLLPEFQSIVTKQCTGTLLNGYLVRSLPLLCRRRLMEVFTNVGIWLKTFHSGYRQEASAAEHDEWARQFDSQFQRPLRSEFDYPTFCHFDYSPRNVFVGTHRVQVIDYASSRPGIAQFDVEFFSDYVCRARFNGLYTRSQKQMLVDAFLDGYANHPATPPMERKPSLVHDAAPSVPALPVTP